MWPLSDRGQLPPPPKTMLKVVKCLSEQDVLEQRICTSAASEHRRTRTRCLQACSQSAAQPLFPITQLPEETAAQRLVFCWGHSLGAASSPVLLNNSRDPEQAEVRDHHFIGVMENVLRLQVLVHDAFCVQVSHSLEDKQQQFTACGFRCHRCVVRLPRTFQIRADLPSSSAANKNDTYSEVCNKLSYVQRLQSSF